MSEIRSSKTAMVISKPDYVQFECPECESCYSEDVGGFIIDEDLYPGGDVQSVCPDCGCEFSAEVEWI